MAKPLKDLTGNVIGQLTVLGFSKRVKGQPYWLCRCSCGVVKEMRHDSITKPNRVSCGCAIGRLTAARVTTHGGAVGRKKSLTYATWGAMKARCRKGGSKENVSLYYDRGITVCEEWRTSYSQFLKDMGERPSSRHSIDRIDNDKGYFPGNCRWAIPKEQARNRRPTIFIEAFGKRQTIDEWVEETGLPRMTIYTRYRRGSRGEDVFRERVKGWHAQKRNRTDLQPNEVA